MKKVLLSIIGITLFATLHAQDYIMLKGGNILNVKIVDVDSFQVTYKKVDSNKVTTSSILKSNVLAIYYRSGAKEDFNTPNEKPILNIDTITFQKGLYVEVSGCLNFQFITLWNLRNDNLSDPLKVYIYSTVDLGYSLSPNISVDLKTDYQKTNYNYSYSESTITPYISRTVANANTNLFITPNLIIQANPNRFIPYGSLGAIAALFNTTSTTTDVVTYNKNYSSTGSETTTFTTTLPFHVGIAAAGGSYLLLSKHFYAFSDLIFEGVFGKTVQSEFKSTGIITGAIGLSAGLKIDI